MRRGTTTLRTVLLVGLLLGPALASAPAQAQGSAGQTSAGTESAGTASQRSTGSAAQQPRARAAQTTPSPSPEAEPGPTSPLQSGTLTITDLRPRAPRPGDPFQVLGTVVNTGAAPIRDVKVRVLRGPRLQSRTEIARRDAEQDPEWLRRLPSEAIAPELAPGVPLKLDLRTLVSQLRLGENGVYPLGIRVSAVDDAGNPFTLAEARTYVPWFNGDKVDRLRLAWLVPVVDQPRRVPAVPTPRADSGRPDEQMLDDVLDESLAERGRLGSLVLAARQNLPCTTREPEVEDGTKAAVVPAERLACTQTPVTFAVDPDLLYSASKMTDDYEVRGAGRPRGPSAAATQFLSGLRTAVEGADDVLSLPYADPDVVAVTEPDPGLSDQMGIARELGNEVTTQLVGTPVDSVALAPPGPVSTAAAQELRLGGTQAVVLDPSALPDPAVVDPGRTSTPGARAALSTILPGPFTGLVVDQGLSDLLVLDPAEDGATDPRLLQQRWLVETAMIAAEAPNDGRTLLVELPRRDPVDPNRVRAALADTGRLPWMCPVTLDAVARGLERCPDQAGGDTEPDRDGALVQATPQLELGDSLTPLSSDVLTDVAALRRQADQLTGSVLAGDEDVVLATRLRLQRAVLRSLSTAWRTDPIPGRAVARALRDELAATFGKVTLNTSKVLLTSTSSQLQVAVNNELDQPVEVQVQLTDPSGRLTVEKSGLVLVAPNTTQSITLDAEAETSGRFLVKAQLLDRKDVAFGPEQQLQVRSTRYGTLALAVTGIAAGVLLVAAGVRVTRRALGAGRRRRAHA